MPVSASYRTFVLDLLGRAAEGIRARGRFGGVGIYAGAFFFALIDNDTLYFKVDDATRGDFEAAGMGPFRPFGEGGDVMQYYQVPAEVLEDADRLAHWTDQAVDVARRARKRKRK